ncbi:MAG TPA: FtsX-like permease family protein, partial [Puia sp.]|nr:FtsX-like permease family protein [Puia sp.]
IGTVVIYNQLNYIHSMNIGFNKEQVLILENTNGLNGRTGDFRNELLKIPGVKNVTITGFMPISGARNTQGYVVTPTFDGKNFNLMDQFLVDENYIPTLQIHLAAGRNFSAQFPSDSGAVIINEAAARILGKGNPINKKIYLIANLNPQKLVPYTVIGVMSNFNFNSLHKQVTPLVLNMQPDNAGMALRINTRDIPNLLGQIKNRWKAMAPAQPFSYYFLEEEFNKQYAAEQHEGDISLIFSALAIFIACLGLFGLVTFAAQQRIREIGIRKVLGADVPDIINLLSKDFVRLIFISILIASPVAWWMMNRWLQDFAYRTTISWWIFVVVGLSALLIALATTIFKTTRAALANPIKSLRVE